MTLCYSVVQLYQELHVVHRTTCTQNTKEAYCKSLETVTYKEKKVLVLTLITFRFGCTVYVHVYTEKFLHYTEKNIQSNNEVSLKRHKTRKIGLLGVNYMFFFLGCPHDQGFH